MQLKEEYASDTGNDIRAKQQIEYDDAMELLASIGVPFGPDGEPLGIGWDKSRLACESPAPDFGMRKHASSVRVSYHTRIFKAKNSCRLNRLQEFLYVQVCFQTMEEVHLSGGR